MKITLYLLMLVLASVDLAGCGGAKAPEQSEAHEESTESATENIAKISENAARAAGIEESVAGSAKLTETISLYGTVSSNSERTLNVAARFPGVVKSVAKSVGDVVKIGEALALIESNDSLQAYAVVSPINGVVTARNTNPGETAETQALFTITDLSTVWVEYSVFPRDLSRLRVGQSVRVASVDGGLKGTGRLIWISSLGTAGTQSVTARALLDNAERKWTPGIYATGDVVVGEKAASVTVRSKALQRINGEAVVFEPVEGGFRAVEVKPGRDDGEFTEVLQGIAAGQRYVSSNSFVVKAELGKAGVEDND